MAQLRLVKDLTQANHKVIDMIISAVMNGNTDSDNDIGVNGKPDSGESTPKPPSSEEGGTISKFDPDKIYNTGDIAYVIVDGKIIIKECIVDGNTGGDFTNGWTIIDGSLGGSSGSNAGTNTSTNFLELLEALSKVVDLSGSDLESIVQYPLYEETDIKQMDGGIYEFGRIIF